MKHIHIHIYIYIYIYIIKRKIIIIIVIILIIIIIIIRIRIRIRLRIRINWNKQIWMSDRSKLATSVDLWSDITAIPLLNPDLGICLLFIMSELVMWSLQCVTCWHWKLMFMVVPNELRCCGCHVVLSPLTAPSVFWSKRIINAVFTIPGMYF